MDALAFWRTPKQVRAFMARGRCGKGGGFVNKSASSFTTILNGTPIDPALTVKVKRGGNMDKRFPVATDNSRPVGRRKTRDYYRTLRAFGQQSRAKGWFNGRPLPKKGLLDRMAVPLPSDVLP